MNAYDGATFDWAAFWWLMLELGVPCLLICGSLTVAAVRAYYRAMKHPDEEAAIARAREVCKQ